jgi:hypothetical protein
MITAETIERVTRFDGGKLPVISVYLGLQMDRRALRSLPAQAPSPAAPDPPNGQGPFTGRAVRLSVRGAIKRGESCRNRDAARLPCVGVPKRRRCS